MIKFARLLVAAMALLAPGSAGAQEPFPTVVVNAVELSGDGAIAGNNFNNGAPLAFEEINAAGGILGSRIEVIALDTQTKPEVVKAALAKAGEMNAHAVLGPVNSGMVQAAMAEIRQNAIPTFIGADAASLTLQGNPWIFRSSLSQTATMPRLARYIKNGLRAETVAMATVDNDFGRGGREAMTKALAEADLQLVADLPTAPDQTDFAGVVEKMVESEADVALCLQALRDQAFGGYVVGETTLMGQSVIDLAGEEAANGVRGHTGMSPDALLPALRAVNDKFLQAYDYKPDHNDLKGYAAAYILKAATEKVGRFDKAGLANAMCGLTLSARDHPGVLLDVRYDDKGDLDRASFIVRVTNRRHEFLTMLPASGGGF